MAATPAIVTRGKPPRARGGMTKKRPLDWLLLVAVILGALVIMVPFYLILVNAFKSPVDYANSGPFALPQAIDLTGIQNVWVQGVGCAEATVNFN